MGHLNERGWINVATLAVYLPLLAGTLFTLFLQRWRMKSFYYLLTFILVKFVGAGMTIDVQLNNNTSLYTPAAILSTVVLTPLVMAVADIINLKHAASSSTRNTPNDRRASRLRPLELVNRTAFPSHPPPSYSPSPYPPTHSYPSSSTTTSTDLNLNKPLPPPTAPRHSTILARLTHLSILLSLGLGVTGGLRVFSSPTSSTPPTADQLSSGETYMRGAAGLAALAVALTFVAAVMGWGRARGMGTQGMQGGRWWGVAYGVVLGVGVPALVARVAYTVGVAATVGEWDGGDGGATSVWDPLRGSWVLYLCLAWVPEVVVGVALVGVGCVKPRA
ncbi:uncharacterized protein BKCO1_8100038 [Diplodia corticola]|uniref:DUF7702 domain-containing protein n=1 Tax=Diplodia corticola TaxID=236234 RepID=A0A1J9RPB7_9PEZI|nr:uncharacterized protein BKCO1_8100038 [Diplodia corticola]OJD29413.1 hypothetical protein BKCO1_8100038 [Diplodia corticola]